jgi:hypothetical protein
MMAYTGGIVALVLAATGGVTASVPVILTAGMVLASSVLCNPLVGAMFAVGYGLTIVVSAPRAGGIRRVLLHGLAVLPVAAAIGWCSLNAMLQGASHALSFGLHGLARHAPFASLVERSVYPRGVEKFEMHPELFTPIFHNREVRVFAVH